MGRPGTGSSSHLPQQQPQNQLEYDLQPQEYQYEATHEAIASGDHHEVALTYESNHYVEENQPDQCQPEQPNNLQAQQQFQPPQPPQRQQQQQPTQFPPQQTNQAYGAQPQRPIRMQQNNQMYQNGQDQPGAYPPQGAKPMPAQPVNFLPASPQNNKMYQNVQTHPGAYQQEGPETIPAKPEQFLPPSPRTSPLFQNGQNRSPAYQPQGQQPLQTYSIPVNFHRTARNFLPPIMQGYQIPIVQGVQFQQSNGQQHVPAGSVPGIPLQRPGSQWSSGLFDCMNDPMNALITALFPCLTFGQIAEIIDEGQTSCGTSGMLYGAIAFCIYAPFIMSCTYRTKLRSKFGLPEAPAPDWITHFMCEWCAICQEYRELQSRGLDPSIGWQGNMARNQNMHQQQVVKMPPVNQRMMG